MHFILKNDYGSKEEAVKNMLIHLPSLADSARYFTKAAVKMTLACKLAAKKITCK